MGCSITIYTKNSSEGPITLIGHDKKMKKLTTPLILQRLMFEKKIRATELARKTQLKQPTVHRIVTGACKNPHIRSLRPLAEFFKITIEQLKGESPINWLHLTNSAKKDIMSINTIPIISWEQANHLSQLFNGKHSESLQYIVVEKIVGPSTFALVMEDSSMYPLFPKGTLLIFDPNKTPKDRGYLLVKKKNQTKPLFRQLLMDGKDQYIKPLSPRFKNISQSIKLLKGTKFMAC